MMRRERSTVLLIVACALLGAYAYFVESGRPTRSEAESARESAFEVESDAIVELRVQVGSEAPTVLTKRDDGWIVTEPVEAKADEAEVSGITSGLATLEIGRVVAEAPDDLEPFGLDAPHVEVAFTTEPDGEPQRLRIGDETATGGDRYASVAADGQVVLIPSYLDTTFNRSTFDLRDKSILEFDRDAVDSLEIAGPADGLRLMKDDGDWTITEPWPARGDSVTIDSLIGRLATSQMRAIVLETGEAGEAHGLDTPRATATIGTGSARAVLEVGAEADDGSAYARDAARAILFTIESSLVDDLTRSPTEYRDKNVFRFRSFDATRLTVERDGATTTFEKAAGEGDEPDEWRRIEPTEGAVDQTMLTDALSKLSTVRAESFVTSEETNVESPDAVFRVWFGDEAEEERVTFGRTEAGVLAVIDGEFGAAAVAPDEYDAAIDALDLVESG